MYGDEHLARRVERAAWSRPPQFWRREGDIFRTEVTVGGVKYAVELWEVECSDGYPGLPNDYVPYWPWPFVGFPIRFNIIGIGREDLSGFRLRHLYKRLRRDVTATRNP